MFRIPKIKIGIINCVTGEVIKEKIVDPELALKEGEKMSRWFDKKDTFFSGSPIWEHWKISMGIGRFEGITRGNYLGSVASASIMVFKAAGDQDHEHEFYMERIEI